MIQLPDAMLAVWHWEYPNGARIYTDGCYLPTEMSEPIPVTGFTHDLDWFDKDRKMTSYGLDGEYVRGLSGDVSFRLADGRSIDIEAAGKWACRYGPMSDGLSRMKVKTSDGRDGTAIYEVTGAHHHRYFPEARAADVPSGLKWQ